MVERIAGFPFGPGSGTDTLTTSPGRPSIALPIVVAGTGAVLHEVGLESSISAYYHSEARLPWLTTRDIFVGGLIAIGACLYLYKGFSNKENIALNFAGVFAVFVALLPTAAAGQPRELVSTLHVTSATLFFLSIAYVSLFRARDTLYLLPPAKRRQYRQLYMATGGAMIASPALAVVLSFALERTSRTSTAIFWVETLAVWSFAAYWMMKTREMRESSAERRALDAELKRALVAADGEVGGQRDRAESIESGAVEAIVPAAHGRDPVVG